MLSLTDLIFLVFTGGVGENDFKMRAMICSDMENLGIIFDFKGNEGVRGKDQVISSNESKVKVMSVTTDEEFVIASETRYIVEHQTV